MKQQSYVVSRVTPTAEAVSYERLGDWESRICIKPWDNKAYLVCSTAMARALHVITWGVLKKIAVGHISVSSCGLSLFISGTAVLVLPTSFQWNSMETQAQKGQYAFRPILLLEIFRQVFKTSLIYFGFYIFWGQKALMYCKKSRLQCCCWYCWGVTAEQLQNYSASQN